MRRRSCSNHHCPGMSYEFSSCYKKCAPVCHKGRLNFNFQERKVVKTLLFQLMEVGVLGAMETALESGGLGKQKIGQKLHKSSSEVWRSQMQWKILPIPSLLHWQMLPRYTRTVQKRLQFT